MTQSTTSLQACITAIENLVYFHDQHQAELLAIGSQARALEQAQGHTAAFAWYQGQMEALYHANGLLCFWESPTATEL